MKKLVIPIALLLSILITTPSILSATTKKVSSETIIDVKTTSNTKTMNVLNMTIPYEENTKIVTYYNGTMKASISLNYTFERKPICVSMEKTIYPETMKPETKVSASESNYEAQIAGGCWPWKTQWDNLTFLKPGTNGSAIVSYAHDDNYDTYYAGLWYARYSLAGAAASHIHIPTDVMTDWHNGVVDRRTVVGIVMGLSGGIASLIMGILASFANPAAAFITICAAIASIWGWIMALLGFTEQNWIRDVVKEKFSGDGWTWTWGQQVASTRMWLSNPYINPYSDVFSDEQCARLWQYHRVDVGTDNNVQYEQSWGSHRDSSDHYSIDVYGDMYLCPGAIVSYPLYSR